MYRAIKEMVNIFQGKQRIPLKVLCTGIFSALACSAWKNTHTLPTFHEVFERCTTLKIQSKAKCQEVTKSVGISKDKEVTDTPKVINAPANELRFILLGATGSGKSTAGNHLLKDETAFKTSCYARSETSKSSLKTLEWKKEQKTWKIDIIDTPANRNTEHNYFDRELKKAIALSAPGPHAFLLCIPATEITESCTEALKPYEEYFENIHDFTIVIFTRYDELKNDGFQKFNTMEEITRGIACFEKFKHNIILRNSDGRDKTEELIQIITSRNPPYAKCALSDHAEKKIQETIVNMNNLKTVTDISRNAVKMNPDFSKHFETSCTFG